MSDILTVGRKLIPLSQVALVEPFDPAQSQLATEKPFQARIVLRDRESTLTEETPAGFAEKHGFKLLAEDKIATNPAIRFRIERFEPASGFKPVKPYRSRLIWRDPDGNVQSKLLVSAPEDVIAMLSAGEVSAPQVRPNRRPAKKRARAPAAKPA